MTNKNKYVLLLVIRPTKAQYTFVGHKTKKGRHYTFVGHKSKNGRHYTFVGHKTNNGRPKADNLSLYSKLKHFRPTLSGNIKLLRSTIVSYAI